MFKIEEIKKSFKDKEVLKGVSFSVEEGDRVALLGNNGAGKSTLFKIISGQLIANSGSVSTKLDFQTEIGMMPQGDILIDDRTANGAGDFSGRHVHFGSPEFPDWQSVLDELS